MGSNENIKTSDLVKVGERTGKVVSAENLSDEKKKYEILFEEEAQIRSYISPPTDIKKVKSPVERAKDLNFDSWRKFDLITEANRLSLAYRYDHLLSLSNSRINLEFYQVEAVYRVINSFKPRFLIADDVGLGKTIETGMIYKELMARGLAERVLIVTPAYLATQCKREMKEKFDDIIVELSSELDQLEDTARKNARQKADNRREEIQEETEREVKIRLEDVNKFYEYRKGRINQRLGEYKDRLDEGEVMEVAIRGEESKLERLKSKYEKRVEELENEKEIIGEDPELLNMSLVIFN